MTPSELATLHALCFPHDPMSVAQASRFLDMPASRLYTAPDAFLLVNVVPPEADIVTLGVHPRSRRRGLARRLVEMVQAEVETLHLDVAASNTAAIALYHTLGFLETARRPSYYTGPDGREDAVLMSWSSTGAVVTASPPDP